MKSIPNEVEYDVLQAKLCASLLWFVCRLSENGFQNIPQEVTSPVEVTSRNGSSIRPAVVDYLTGGAMYLYIGSVMFKQEFDNLWDLIQKMSHNGVYVMCENDQAVTDQDLVTKNPFNLSAHLSLMDSIQIVYGNSIVTVPDVLGVIRSISTFNAAKEMPFDVEDALVLWLSKINEIISADFKREEQGGNTDSTLVLSKTLPVVKNVCESFQNTKTMLSLLLFYMPDFVGAESMKLANTLTVYEKASNIELFRCLCAEHICTSVFSLRMEDMLFAREPLKPNFLALLCEMFYKIELERKDIKLFNQLTPEESPQIQMGDRNESSLLPRQQQQLLTRRSKKVFASLNSESDNAELLFDDLELTRSHLIPTIPPNQHGHIAVSQAWAGDSPTNDGRKPEKINLSFRPDYGSLSSRTTSNSNSDIDGSESYSLTGSVLSSKGSMNPPLHYNHSYGGVRSSYDYLALYPADLQEGDYQSFCGSSGAESWHDMEKRNSYNDRPPLPPRGSQFLPYDKKAGLINMPNNIGGPGSSIGSIPNDLDEDALSTITEITEPDRGSNYSLHSSSSSVATKASNDDFDEDGISLNTTLQGSDYIEEAKTGSFLQKNQIPPDDVLLATLSKTYKDTNKQLHGNTSEKLVLPNEVENVQGTTNNSSSTLLPVKTSDIDSPVSAPRCLGSPEKMMRGSYTVKHGTRESAVLSGHPIITESIKESYDQFNIRVRSDLATNETDAWYLTQSGLPPSISIENENDNDSHYDDKTTSVDNTNPSNNDISYNVTEISVNNTNDISLTSLDTEMSFNDESKPLDTEMSFNDESKTEMSFNDESKLSKSYCETIREEAIERTHSKSRSYTEQQNRNHFKNIPELVTSFRDNEHKSNVNKQNYNRLTSIQNNTFEMTVNDSVANLNDLNKLTTLWNATENMILSSMVKTTDNNMVFNKTFVSRELDTVNHLSSLSKNNNNNIEEGKMLSSDIEKIRFTASKLSAAGKNIDENDYTTWIDLFNTNNLDVKGHINKDMIKKNQDKLKRYKSSLTTWADQPHLTLNGGNEGEDEALSVQLAALRMQLEEKRRKFNEEKEKKQELWREERAKNLQNAFFLMLQNEEQRKVDPSTTNTECEERNDLVSSQLFTENICEEVKLTSNDVPDNKASYIVENRSAIPVKQTSENIILPSIEPDNKICYSNMSEHRNEMKQLSENQNFHANTTHHDVDLEPIQDQYSNPLQPTQTNYDTNSVKLDHSLSSLMQDTNSVKLDHSLSSLMQDFSPFAQPEVVPVAPIGFTSQESISSVLNQLGSPEDPLRTLLSEQFTQGDAPQTSAVLDQLGNNNNVAEITAIETYKKEDESSFSSNTNSAYVLCQPDSIGIFPAMEPRPTYTENNQLPNATIDSVLEQVKCSPVASLNYEEIIPKDEAPSASQVLHSEDKTWNEQSLPHTEISTEDEELHIHTTPEASQPLHLTDTQTQVIGAQTDVSEDIASIIPEDNTENTPISMAFSIGVDMMECPELTPQQVKKRERFLRQRQKNMAEEKEKKAAELESSTFQVQKPRMVEGTPKKVLREEAASTPKKPSRDELMCTPKRISREECRREISSQEHQKDSCNLYQESLMKRVGSDVQETPSRRGKRELSSPRSPRTPQNPSNPPGTPSDEASRYAEYTGPDAYKKPSGKSNRKIIQNAIMHCCLCGEVNKDAKKKCVDAMEKSEANHFLVLFREGLKFRSVYEYHPDSEMVTRVYGIGPKSINEKMMTKYYKYNSGGKEFYPLETKHLSIQVDGLMIKKELWDKKHNISKTDSSLKKFVGNNQKQGP